MLSRNQADGLVTGAEKVKRYGELIHQQSRRLNEMVEQTLQYAGIHSGVRKPLKNRIALRPLIEQAVEARREELACADSKSRSRSVPICRRYWATRNCCERRSTTC